MKYSKSITSDTRLTNSHILNLSSFQNGSIPNESKDKYFSSQIQNSEQRELQFLKFKNAQLEERIRRLSSEIDQLQSQKKDLLTLNHQYINVVNRYYEDTNKKISKKKSQEGKVLQSLERDHRNLVKHCLAMQTEIKNYIKEMEKFEEMKVELREANHTSVKELFSELLDLAEENRQVKKKNNKLCYELEKGKMEYEGIQKAHKEKQMETGNIQVQLAKMKSLINSLQQENVDKSNAYEAKIYQLTIKIQKLQQQLRREQVEVEKSMSKRKFFQMREVQHVHERDKLHKSLKNLRGRVDSIEKTKSTMLGKQKRGRKTFIGKLGEL